MYTLVVEKLPRSQSPGAKEDGRLRMRGREHPGNGVELTMQDVNRPFPSCAKPLFQGKAKCETIDMKMFFLFSCEMRMKLIFTRKVLHVTSL